METTKIIKGTLKYLYNGVSRFDKTKTKKFILQVASDALEKLAHDDEIKKCYDKSVLLPGWYKGDNDKINLTSLFNIPVEYNGHKYDTEDFISDFKEFIKESEVTIKLKFKDGACYPQAIRFDKLGDKQEVFDPFVDFDDNDDFIEDADDDSLPFN